MVNPSHRPLVTVVVPAYNAQEWVQDAIESVQAQTYTNWELVVVDDGSTDDTPDLVAASKAGSAQSIRLERLSHQGVSTARNAGASIARGEFLAFLDADDVWHPEKLEKQIQLLARHPHLEGVGCAFEAVSCDLKRLIKSYEVSWSLHSIQSWLLLENHGVLLPSTLLVRKRAFEATGGFNEDLSTAADLDLAWRLAQHQAVGTVEETLVKYRRCAGQMHRDIGLLLHDYSILARLHPEVLDERTLRSVHFNLRLLDTARRASEAGLLRHIPSLLGLFVESPSQFVRWFWKRSPKL